MKRIFIIFFLLIFYQSTIYAQRTIHFAGIDWYVRSGTGGPGPNNWSDSDQSVWVDANGYLHLKIRKVNNTWYCAQIYSKKSFGYGEYRFYVGSNVENFDPNTVVGLFTYENDSHEIDIEFSRWGNSKNVDGWYTVQPGPYNSTNQKSFPLNLSGNYSTHIFNWYSNSIFFQSYHGHYATLPSSNYLINQWTYKGSNDPTPGNERLHINFWLDKGAPPKNGQEAELIITWVSVPSGSLEVTISPSGAVNNDAQWNIDGGDWHNSGVLVNNVTAGKHTIYYKNISGWTAPENKNITISANACNIASGTYMRQTGSLKVTISPNSAVNAGAKWNLDSENWQNSGTTINNIPTGKHTVYYESIYGWKTPSNKEETIYANQTTSLLGGYTQKYISVFPSKMNLSGISGNQQTFKIKSNVGWSISGAQDWFSINPTSGTNDATITVTAEKNWPGSDRTATLTIKSDNEDVSQIIVIKQSSTTGIQEQKIEKSISIYPNPAKSAINIQFKDLTYKNVSICLYKSQGKALITKHFYQTPSAPINLNLANYPTGLYYLQLVTNKGIATKKIIIQR